MPMSALPPKADIRQRDFHVRYGPNADIILLLGRFTAFHCRSCPDQGTGEAFGKFSHQLPRQISPPHATGSISNVLRQR